MCGLTGILDFARRTSADVLRHHAATMADALRHRGPDDAGTWVEAEAGIALGHRRLSILDLSELGHQPMVSATGRFVIAYNGEIYNFRALRQRLEAGGHRFRGHSDTEVMLASFETDGVAATLEQLNGMFAFGLWDASRRELHLARDRLGEKPLYYTWMGGQLLFASELKALRAHPSFRGEIDRRAVALYARHSCIPAPHSVFEGVFKLRPATHMVVRADGRGPDAAERMYWSPRAAAEAGTRDLLTGRSDEILDQFEELLGDAVGLRMEADVPLGAFLSGGIDSTTVVALMQRRAYRPVKTFTIGFDDPAYDESASAAAVARHLGTDHTELKVSSSDVLAVVPRLPDLYDEPFGDDSQIPTFLVSQLARGDVTVALSGDGGDELFAGYNRHTLSAVPGRLRRLPRGGRQAAARLLASVPPARWDEWFARADGILPRRLRMRTPAVKVQKLVDILTTDSPEAMYLQLTSCWKQPSRLVIGGDEPVTKVTDAGEWLRSDRPLDRLLYLDLVSYLPDDILVKVDRAAMAVSLESRIPFLDHRVVEFAWRVPHQFKLQGGQGKWLLRRLLDRHIPRSLVERPKAGFGLPIGSWLRGPLRSWAESLLDPARLREEGFFVADEVRGVWDQHLQGRRDAQCELWNILMFQSWLAGNPT